MRQCIKKNPSIPLRHTDLIQACLDDGCLPYERQNVFKDLCLIIVSTLHFGSHQILDKLKDSYVLFDSNSDSLTFDQLTGNILQTKQDNFTPKFIQVLSVANFEKVTHQDLKEALQEESLFKVRLPFEFEDFAEVVFYRRGEYQKRPKPTVSFGDYAKRLRSPITTRWPYISSLKMQITLAK
jgi:hypothetical protein